MRIEFIQSIDFNQMLVYSTFVHLFFLTVITFLPNPKIQEQIVVPTFQLDLIELPSVSKPASTPLKKQKVDLLIIMVPGLYPDEVLKTVNNMKLSGLEIAMLKDNKIEFK